MKQERLSKVWDALKTTFSEALKGFPIEPTQLPNDKPYLLIVDLDAFYTEHRPFPDNLTRSINEFLEKNRHRFNVIHVWHATDLNMPQYMRERFSPLLETAGIVTPVSDIENQVAVQDYNPLSRPQAGEWLLGKTRNTPFYNTNLGTSLPENAQIFTFGAYGYDCISNTIKEVSQRGFQMIALEDLIFPNNHLFSCDDFPRQIEMHEEALEYNPDVLTALLP